MNLLTPHQAKALDYKNHISLTANAGSGKTFVLSKRYLEIALNENLPLRNIAAITFTDKAAGELYQKIAKEIDERIKAAEEKSLIEKLEQIRGQLVSANISTIHSFCINILKFLNTIRESNNFSWTYKCTKINSIIRLFIYLFKLTNLMDRIEEQDIYS